MLDGNGDSALHLAVEKCNPKMVSALLGHPDIDISVINENACTAIWKLNEFEDLSKTINWVRMLSTNITFNLHFSRNDLVEETNLLCDVYNTIQLFQCC